MSPSGDCAEGPHGLIGYWDVLDVTEMGRLFAYASSFNQDLSNWDVSAVVSMSVMFHGASAYKRELCGAAWVNSKAAKSDMFKESPGSISSTVCATPTHGHGEGYGLSSA